MNRTIHANKRIQQRGVPPIVLDLLINYGTRTPAGDGTEICYFDRKAKKLVTSYLGGLIGKMNEQLDSYIVLSGKEIITVGSRFKKINHI